MKHVLVAGATGYLGQYLVKELKNKGFWVRVLIRKESQKSLFEQVDDFYVGEITKPESIQDLTQNIDWVISTIGITRQKDGLTYMDVDYQGNANLLALAKKDKVEKFQYISALNGDRLKHLKIFEAKEKFVDELKQSGLSYSIVRPCGFFSDMKDFLDMAKSGRVYLFGDGNLKMNPIHGEDLAKVCLQLIQGENKESTVGGPDIFTQNDIATLALQAWGNPIKISHLPDAIRKLTIWLLRTFTSSKTYGPFEFFLTAMALDNVADVYGDHQLEIYFNNNTYNS
ncbi:SDR family oxidoreductase [Flammeovirga agarivorans]|uniref:SDR family oxidoreductase n=1 Tax=Flammeovirga agarivorans TaxID=2726742 RepID=A0A7X8SJU4_9BACT|nr:SDR family oxidoreductase [Flammeovirga agarivorans]NLR91448.1 SDR family oxidoreductase [Flammeovirga agarivorans]